MLAGLPVGLKAALVETLSLSVYSAHIGKKSGVRRSRRRTSFTESVRVGKRAVSAFPRTRPRADVQRYQLGTNANGLGEAEKTRGRGRNSTDFLFISSRVGGRRTRAFVAQNSTCIIGWML